MERPLALSRCDDEGLPAERYLDLSRANGRIVDWRNYLAGNEHELDFLVRRFTEGRLVVGRDEIGVYLTGEGFDGLDDAQAVLDAGAELLPRIIGYARYLNGGFGFVTLAGRVARADLSALTVYVDDSLQVTDDFQVAVFGGAYMEVQVIVTAEGEVRHAEGNLVSRSDKSDVAKLWDDSADPQFAKAMRQFGLDPVQNLPNLYKVFESLRKLAGGEDQLVAMSGVPKLRIKLLTANSNHQGLGGDGARHSEMRGTPKPEDKITLAEAEQIVKDLISGMRAVISGPKQS